MILSGLQDLLGSGVCGSVFTKHSNTGGTAENPNALHSHKRVIINTVKTILYVTVLKVKAKPEAYIN